MTEIRLPSVGARGSLKWWAGEYNLNGSPLIRWCRGTFIAVSESHISVKDSKTGEVATVRLEDVRELREKP